MEYAILDMLNMIEDMSGSSSGALGLYLVLVNVLTFAAYGIDKFKAKRGSWRISEKTLLGLAFIGGSPGAFAAMKVFRHKTKHKIFYIGVPAVLALHLIILCYVTL